MSISNKLIFDKKGGYILIESLLLGILVVLTFGFTYLTTTERGMPFVVTLIVVLVVYLIGKIIEKGKMNENDEKKKF